MGLGEDLLGLVGICLLDGDLTDLAEQEVELIRTDRPSGEVEFQKLCLMDGSRTPLNGKRLKMYIMSMREVVEAYKRHLFTANTQKRG